MSAPRKMPKKLSFVKSTLVDIRLASTFLTNIVIHSSGGMGNLPYILPDSSETELIVLHETECTISNQKIRLLNIY